MYTFLKYAGSKQQIIADIKPHFKDKECLIEPFMGSGAVFINTDFKKYILNDTNADLMAIFQNLKDNPVQFIADAKHYFNQYHNIERYFYAMRARYNESSDCYERALILLYLNRHCHRGLVRYNLSGNYNVPFGYNKRVAFPDRSLNQFADKFQRVETEIHHVTAIELLKSCQHNPKLNNATIYNDPPYFIQSKSANFTQYSGKKYTNIDASELHILCQSLRLQGFHVFTSNAATADAMALYQGHTLHEIDAVRKIGRTRTQTTKEILVEY